MVAQPTNMSIASNETDAATAGGYRMSLEIRQPGSAMAALGAAAHFLAQRPPFATFPAGALIATLHGQVRRRHCLFAVEGQQVRAYLGWALLDAAVAERLAASGRAPAPAECEGADVVWLLTVAATDTAALRVGLEAGRALHPGWRVMGVRRRPNGHAVLIDRRIRPSTGAIG